MELNATSGTLRSCQNLKLDGRVQTSAGNGRLGGRPRKHLDSVEWGRLALLGMSNRASANRLGMSLRTFLRRKRERRLENSAW
jgi:hypothetical protein